MYDLISEFNKKNEASYRPIFDLFYKQIFLYCYRILGDRDEAEDVAIGVFSAMFSGKYRDFADLPSFKSFIYKVAKNNALNLVKLNKRRALRYSKQQLESIEFETAEHQLIKEELIKEMLRKIEELPADCRRIFKMIHLEEMKPIDIARILNISVSTVYVQNMRGLQSLKLKMKH